MSSTYQVSKTYVTRARQVRVPPGLQEELTGQERDLHGTSTCLLKVSWRRFNAEKGDSSHEMEKAACKDIVHQEGP
jgi:hypothetical protein